MKRSKLSSHIIAFDNTDICWEPSNRTAESIWKFFAFHLFLLSSLTHIPRALKLNERVIDLAIAYDCNKVKKKVYKYS